MGRYLDPGAFSSSPGLREDQCSPTRREGEAFTLDGTRSRGILVRWGRGGFIAPAHAQAVVRLPSGGEDVREVG